MRRERMQTGSLRREFFRYSYQSLVSRRACMSTTWRRSFDRLKQQEVPGGFDGRTMVGTGWVGLRME